LYDGLRALPEERRRLIDMTRISKVNTLFGEEAEKRAQRRDARFINETMMVTLLGAAVSDALDDGRVVSGVGGQFDFVSMAQSLDGAMSILMCRACRESGGKVSSNIRWNYGHNTVPRHHRDVFVTEYGIAATRGCSDRDTIDRLLHVAGAEFHESLIEAPRRSGKIERDYRMAGDAARNRPDVIASVFNQHRAHFPAYPLGTELTGDEQVLAEALGWLQNNTATTGKRVRTIFSAMNSTPSGFEKTLARMGLEKPTRFKDRLMQRLLRYALASRRNV
jgi:acyl-CoA hydrolase